MPNLRTGDPWEEGWEKFLDSVGMMRGISVLSTYEDGGDEEPGDLQCSPTIPRSACLTEPAQNASDQVRLLLSCRFQLRDRVRHTQRPLEGVVIDRTVIAGQVWIKVQCDGSEPGLAIHAFSVPADLLEPCSVPAEVSQESERKRMETNDRMSE